jgi:hypothetical protein
MSMPRNPRLLSSFFERVTRDTRAVCVENFDALQRPLDRAPVSTTRYLHTKLGHLGITIMPSGVSRTRLKVDNPVAALVAILAGADAIIDAPAVYVHCELIEASKTIFFPFLVSLFSGRR